MRHSPVCESCVGAGKGGRMRGCMCMCYSNGFVLFVFCNSGAKRIFVGPFVRRFVATSCNFGCFGWRCEPIRARWPGKLQVLQTALPKSVPVRVASYSSVNTDEHLVQR